MRAGLNIVSKVLVDISPTHGTLHVWNRGGKSGTLVVEYRDAFLIATRLNPGFLSYKSWSFERVGDLDVWHGESYDFSEYEVRIIRTDDNEYIWEVWLMDEHPSVIERGSCGLTPCFIQSVNFCEEQIKSINNQS